MDKCIIHPECLLNNNHRGLCVLQTYYRRKPKSNVIHIQRSKKSFKLGMYVLAQYGKDDDELWWRGKIKRVHRDDTYDIKYNDGDFEINKPANKIKKIDYDTDVIDGIIIYSSLKSL